MAIVKIMYWKDIPCSVRAEEGRRKRVTAKLPDLYMTVIDAVAMKEGLTAAEEYQNGFVWGQPEERPGTVEEAAAAALTEVLAKYPPTWLISRAQQAGAMVDETG
jgi:hypothetical protein